MRVQTLMVAALLVCLAAAAPRPAAAAGRRRLEQAKAPAPKAVPAPKAAPVAVAEPAAGGLGAKAVAPHRERHGAEFCNCGTEDEPVCGTDQQTYLNECVMTCAGAIKAKDGLCDKDCYPPSKKSSDDWSSRDAVCASGITYMNNAEAKADGYPSKCIKPGVCTYVAPRGEAVSYEPTTGGKGKKWEDAAGNTQLPSKASPDYDYSEALAKSLMYYDAQISGMIEDNNVQRVDWRANSCFDCKGKKGEDLSGGYYESGGSSLKLGAISAYTVAFLASNALCFPGGYSKTGLNDDIKFKVKWGADFLINSHVGEFEYMGSMGNNTEDFDMFAPIELYEKYAPNKRITGYCTKDQPCSEITADAAAGLAAASQLLKADNPAWSAKALKHAKELYTFASEYPGSYMDSSDPAMKVHSYLYSSKGYKDELAFAAAVLYQATGEEKYKADASKYFDENADTPQTQEVGELKPLTAVLMARLDPGNAKYRKAAEAFFNQYLEGEIRHTDCGLAMPYHWGGMTHGQNIAALGMCYAKAEGVDPAYAARLFNYGKHQVDYVLGDCGRSWMVGFGKDYPRFLHQEHTYNSILVWKDENDPLGEKVAGTMHPGPITTENTERPQMWMKGKLDFEGNWFPQRHIGYGTMFGAPLMNDGMPLSRRDYTYTEPTIVYNSGLVSALAGLSEYYDVKPWAGELKEARSAAQMPGYAAYLKKP